MNITIGISFNGGRKVGQRLIWVRAIETKKWMNIGKPCDLNITLASSSFHSTEREKATQVTCALMRSSNINVISKGKLKQKAHALMCGRYLCQLCTLSVQVLWMHVWPRLNRHMFSWFITLKITLSHFQWPDLFLSNCCRLTRGPGQMNLMGHVPITRLVWA